MSFKINYSDYTTRARRFVTKYPLLNHILIQVNFWIAAFLVLSTIMYFANSIFKESLSIPINIRFRPSAVISIISGIIYGFALGLSDIFFDKEFFRNKPLGKIIVLKSLIALILLVLVYAFIRFFLFDRIAVATLDTENAVMTSKGWKGFLILILIYCFFMTLIINFIIQVNKKFGPGVLVPLLLGKYRNPQEEERAFLFMDLQSSTTIAEALGHIRYSAFIRDSFMAINKVLNKYDAEVYQYVGDEIVISWRINEVKKKTACVEFFFACQEQFKSRDDYYLATYGVLPVFKAGLHMGQVTAVEIGEIKRDIAYHGDTLNTAARIQSMCNKFEKKFLVSSYFSEEASLHQHFKTHPMGEIMLKGKTVPVGILSVEEPI